MSERSGISVEQRARRIRLLALDVDGVVTDGVVLLGAECDYRAFSVRDGLGIALARAGGLIVAWVSARQSAAVARRARELGVDRVLQGVRNKGSAVTELASSHGVALEQVAFMGDDLNDLSALRMAGLALAPCDAAPEIRAAAHYITAAPGGRGAVREVVELILRAQGRLEQAQAAYVAGLEGAPGESAPDADLGAGQ